VQKLGKKKGNFFAPEKDGGRTALGGGVFENCEGKQGEINHCFNSESERETSTKRKKDRTNHAQSSVKNVVIGQQL